MSLKPNIPDDAVTATNALSSAIQSLFDERFGIEEVTVALSDAFHLCLMSAGAKQAVVQRDSKRLHKKLARQGYDRRRAKLAVERLGTAISDLEMNGITSETIAWSLAAALTKIVRACLPGSTEQIDQLTYGLIRQIKMAEAA